MSSSNDSSRLYPSKEELKTLRPKLTEGEAALVEFLDESLTSSWSIYVQPYINNMRPDVVVLNPQIGLVVFEVKDWSLGRYQLINGQLFAETATSKWIEDNPVLKSRWYAENLYSQFLACDEAEQKVGFTPNDHSICRHAVYFHKSREEEVLSLFSEFRRKDDILLGTDSLRKDNLDNIVPYNFMQRSKFIRERQVEALKAAHTWLIPPIHATEHQSRLPEPSTEQREYCKPVSGFRRVRGVAGSGKTHVLAHRAGRACEEGRSILILSFTITLSHILHDKLKRAPYSLDWKRICWGHFHGWAKSQSVESGLMPIEQKNLPVPESESDSDWQDLIQDDFDTILEDNLGPQKNELQRSVACLHDIVSGSELAPGYTKPKYGAIYVDEAQDFEPLWLDILAQYLEENGELVIFADHKQNLYGRDGGRDKLTPMTHCRFRGPWAQLPRKSRRLPWRVALFLNDFAQKTRLGDEEDFSIADFEERRAEPELSLDVVGWLPVTSTADAVKSISFARSKFGNPNPGDIVVLVPSHKVGFMAVEILSSDFDQIVHVFGLTQSESRKRKLAFWMGRGGIKMCTIHSFKGWELNNVIVIWPPNEEMKWIPKAQRDALLYTAVSRAMRNIVVLNANRDYDQFFDGWEKYSLEVEANGQT